MTGWPSRILAFARGRRIVIFTAAALILLPVFFDPHVPWRGRTFAYLFVIDVSESMNVRDVDPARADESRLDAAKASVVAVMENLPCGSRVSLALFAGSDTLVLFEPIEVCRHFPAIEQAVRGIDWRMAWDGDSRIEAALVNAIREAAKRDLDLIFLTDGDETPRISVPHLGELLALAGKVKGRLIGIGGSDPRPVPKLDADNRVIGYWSRLDAVREGFYPNLAEQVKNADSAEALERSGALDEVHEHESAMNEEYLQQLGSAAGLGYLHALSPPHVAAAALDGDLAREQEAERDLRFIFALTAAALLLSGWMLSGRVRRRGFIASLRASAFAARARAFRA